MDKNMDKNAENRADFWQGKRVLFYTAIEKF